MGFITFIYIIENNPNRFFGKYCFNYISDDHDGLDNEVKYILKEALNKYRKNKGLAILKSNNIKIGILSFSSDQIIPTDSSKKEFECFDFYCNYNNKVYVDGVLV